jgi:hypothetical protein
MPDIFLFPFITFAAKSRNNTRIRLLLPHLSTLFYQPVKRKTTSSIEIRVVTEELAEMRLKTIEAFLRLVKL